MFKRALIAIALVGMVASPAAADLLVPDASLTPVHASTAGTIGVWNGVSIVGSQVSIPAIPSDTIVVTFAFHWPFSTYYPVPYLGVQWQNRLVYDNHEVQIIGASGAGVWNAVNFAGSIMTANTATATQTGPGGTPLKTYPNPSSGIISTAPGFGRFAVNPPTTVTFPKGTFTTTPGGGQGTQFITTTTTGGMLIPFSTSQPFFRVTLHVKKVTGDGAVDIFLPPTSNFLLLRVLVTIQTPGTHSAFSFTGPTTTRTVALAPLYYTGSNVGLIGGDFGASLIPEPASAALLGIGLFSLVGGAWRRRRRMSR